MAISYITAPPSSSTSKTPPSTVPLTANLAIHPTHTIHSPDVAPGTLDILVVPGPDPSETFTPEALEFLRAHAQHDRRPCDVLGVCTGIFVCAAAGILRGKQACGPRGLQGQLAAKYPDTEWVGDKFRWIQDGNVWSSGEFLFFNSVRHFNHFIFYFYYPCRNPPFTPLPRLLLSP